MCEEAGGAIPSDNIAPTGIARVEGPIRRRTRLGGILTFYHRAA